MNINALTKNYLKKKISGYVSKDQKIADYHGFLKLDLGENLLGSANVTKKVRSINEEVIGYYADPSNSSIKKKLSKLHRLSYRSILIANNSNEIIDFVPKMILESGDKSLFLLPTFYRFIDSTMQVSDNFVLVKLMQDELSQEKIVGEIIRKANKHAVKIIWICNPNNPTGDVIDIKSIEEIVKSVKSFVIVDEAFFEFYNPDNKESATRLVNKYKNLLVIRTLSKAYGLAGMRFGYAIAHEKTIETIESFRDTLLMTSALVVKLAEEAISDQDFIKKTAEETAQIRKEIFAKISKLENLEIAGSPKTNIYLIRHKNKDLYEELLKKKIKACDFRKSLGLERKGYVRLTVGKRDTNAKLIKALREIN